MSQGADGSRGWGQQAAELAVPTCPASASTVRQSQSPKVLPDPAADTSCFDQEGCVKAV